MSINDHLNKIKPWLIPVNLVLIGLLGFGLGRLSRLEDSREPVTIESSREENRKEINNKESQTLVGSKNGSKYHYPWCSGAKRIKEENKVWFASVEEAKQAGYTPAGNCPGLD